jgi:hypothetical protein
MYLAGVLRNPSTYNAMGIDTKDRKKITDRTRKRPDPSYDYRLELTREAADGPFSFLALGDAGSKGSKHRIKYVVADTMNGESGIGFILHLGDVVYSSGSKEGYKDRFIKAYHHWLKNGKNHRFDDMVFTKPFLPVYGNHDYYDLKDAIGIPLLGGLIGAIVAEVEDEVGSGSNNGEVFEKAFIAADLSGVRNGRLPYVSGERTRLPNRYYWFTQGPCAFFALDSNTLDVVGPPTPAQRERLEAEREAAEARAALRRKQYGLLERHIRLGGVAPEVNPQEVENTLYDIVIDLAEAEKEVAMLEKQIEAKREDFDEAQMAWLVQALQHTDVQGKWKVVYLHHPLYSSDASHTDDPESDGLRSNLRRVLAENGVHLVLSGHSHCFEWATRAPARPGEDARLIEAERRICYLVSGGGGRHLRRSILEGDPSTLEDDPSSIRARLQVLLHREQFLKIADSRAYTAFPGQDEREPIYHYLRVDASEERLRVTPVGVRESPGGSAIRESPIRTKVLRRTGDAIAVESRRLRHIDVFRDRAPEATFL